MGAATGPAARDFSIKYRAEGITTANRRNSVNSNETRIASRNKIAAKNGQMRKQKEYCTDLASPIQK